MILLPLSKVPERIQELKNEHCFDDADELQSKYDAVNQMLSDISLQELVLLYMLRCCPSARFNNYFRMIEAEALFTDTFQRFLSERSEFLKSIENPVEV